MSNEATISISFSISKGNIQYQNHPKSFRADVDDGHGPLPGAFEVPVAGIDVDLSAIPSPGLCMLYNMDDTNFVQYGIQDYNTGVFYPLGEILPGEFYPIRLSRNLGQDYPDSGTGTGPEVHMLHFKADTAACWVRVDAFGK